MKTYMTAEYATNLAIDTYEAEGIMINTNIVRQIVYEWYENTDITDPEVLATCALEGIHYTPTIDYMDILLLRDLYFPAEPYDNISIYEIEAAQYDAMYW